MATLQIRLLGGFFVGRDERMLPGLEAGKVQELFAYLALKPRTHSREALASLLWPDVPIAQARKYLRQTLWQLRGALDSCVAPADSPILLVEPDVVHLNGDAALWVDVSAFERASLAARTAAAPHLSEGAVCLLRDAADVYRGALLDGWYVDWCLFERERLQGLYLDILDALMIHCGVIGDYASGRHYGMCALQLDSASERTHQHLMRFHYLAGDRTAALRQYARCVAALDGELGVGPARTTINLLEQIQDDRLGVSDIARGRLLTGHELWSNNRESLRLDEVVLGLARLLAQHLALDRDVVRGVQALDQQRPTGDGLGALSPRLSPRREVRWMFPAQGVAEVADETTVAV